MKLVRNIVAMVVLLSSLAFSADVCSGLYDAGDYHKSGDCYIRQLKKDKTLVNYYFTGDSLRKQGRNKEALTYLNEAEKLANKEADLGLIYNRLSMLYGNLGDKKSELAYNMKALNIVLKGNNKNDIASTYSNLGNYYARLKDENKALEFYNKALEYNNENASIYTNMAISYGNLNNFDKAEEFYKKAIAIDLNKGDYLSLCGDKSNFGIFYYNQNKYNEAIPMLEEAKDICHKSGDISDEANSLISLGLISLKQGNLTSAKSYYAQAKPLAIQSGNSVVFSSLNSLKNKIDNQ